MTRTMRAALAAIALAFAFFMPAHSFAQQTSAFTVAPCVTATAGTSKNAVPFCAPVTASNPLPVNATVTATASITGFTAATIGTPISVTTASSTGTLPGGTVVVATNVGANGAFCELGATGTSAAQFISPGGGWFAYTVGASTQLSCITSSGSTTVNLVGGSGLPTGTGGGGGGTGGSVTVTSSALPTGASTSALQPAINGDGGSLEHVTNFPATQPVSAASLPLPSGAATAANQEVTAAGTSATSAQAVQGVANGVPMPVSAASLPLPAGAATQTTLALILSGQATAALQTTGNNSLVSILNALGSTLTVNCSNCSGGGSGGGGSTPQATTSAPINISTATTTQLIAAISTDLIYVTSWDVISAGAGNITLEYGTGSNCGTGTTLLTGAYNLAAQAGISKGDGLGAVYIIPASNALCAVTSANVQYSGSVSFTQSPTTITSFGGGGGGSSAPADQNLMAPTGTISAANNFSTGLVVQNWQNGRVTLSGTPTTGSVLAFPGFAGWNAGILECTGAGTQGTNQFEVDVTGPTGGTVFRRVATFTGPTASIPVNFAGQTFLNVVADVWSAGAPTCQLRASVNQSVPDDSAVPLQADSSQPVSLSAAAVNLLLPAVAGEVAYITSLNFIAAGTTNVTFEAGTQTTNPCDTGTVLLSGAYPLVAQFGVGLGNGLGLSLVVPPGDQLCAVNSAAVQVSGFMAFTRR
jgi:hypothetical protein